MAATGTKVKDKIRYEYGVGLGSGVCSSVGLALMEGSDWLIGTHHRIARACAGVSVSVSVGVSVGVGVSVSVGMSE